MDDFFKITPVVDEIQASVNCKYKKTVNFREKNPDLLRQEEANLSEEANDDADVNEVAKKVDDYNNDMFVTIE